MRTQSNERRVILSIEWDRNRSITTLKHLFYFIAFFDYKVIYDLFLKKKYPVGKLNRDRKLCVNMDQ